MPQQRTKGRKDHLLPQGYLRGFIAPQSADSPRPLWHYDVRAGTWSPKSTREVGWKKGFYDLAGTAEDIEHPDDLFARFEREFPIIRASLAKQLYRNFVKHRPFLLGFVQMMRARSPLFFDQQFAYLSSLRGATITAIDGNTVTVDSLELRPFPSNTVRNGVIRRMGEEIKKGPDWLDTMNWCLRYTTNPANGFITGSQPLTVVGPSQDLPTALRQSQTLLFFPISWQACMIGAIGRFHVGVDIADAGLIRLQRRAAINLESDYLIAGAPFELSSAEERPAPPPWPLAWAAVRRL